METTTATDTLTAAPKYNSRQQTRRLMRRIGEAAMRMLIRGVPRRDVRHSGRIYGSAAYRYHMGLPNQTYKHKKLVPNPQVLAWVVREARKAL